MTNPAHQPSPAIVDLQQRVKTLEEQHDWLKAENARLWDALNSSNKTRSDQC